MGGASHRDMRWGAGVIREVYVNEMLLMGGRKDEGGKRAIQKNGRNRWCGKARFKGVTIATEPRYGVFKVQGCNINTS